MKKIFYPVLPIMILAASTQVCAEEGSSSGPLIDKTKLSLGAGISRNSVSSLDETGFQFFMGYDLDQVNLLEGVNTSVEFGYMDYGSFPLGNSGGLWVTGVIDGAITEQVNWLARLGLDLGDDDGFMFGVGAEYELDAKMGLRGEYVVRDNVDSIQFNFVYHL